MDIINPKTSRSNRKIVFIPIGLALIIFTISAIFVIYKTLIGGTKTHGILGTTSESATVETTTPKMMSSPSAATVKVTQRTLIGGTKIHGVLGTTSEFAKVETTTPWVMSSPSAATLKLPKRFCNEHQFQCQIGICLEKYLWCDGYWNCPDASDEPPNCSCLADFYKCRSGRCIPKKYFCDGVEDCIDRSDEQPNCTCFDQWQYRCLGRCIAKENYCDGDIHCDDASDEINCTCTSEQFRCNSGQCAHKESRCNKLTECKDKSDEMFCNCTGFQCKSGLCLWNSYYRCNGFIECDDLSDELNCAGKTGYRQCHNSIWIRNSEWCNGIDNCYDNSDETSCTCSQNEIRCSNGKCIPNTWLCDGYSDCSNGSDERRCDSCHPEEHICDNYQCVNTSSVCDGVFDCSDASDEKNCVELRNYNGSIGGTLFIHFKENTFPVCFTNWTKDYSDTICQFLNYRESEWIRGEPVSTNTTSFLEVNSSLLTSERGPSSFLTAFYIQKFCESGAVLSVLCKTKACGQRMALPNFSPLIIGGDLSWSGQWPWMAYQRHLGKFICGATLIARQWLITAGHCISIKDQFNFTLTPFYLDYTFGSINQTFNTPLNGARVRAKKVFVHPRMNSQFHWDIALIQLEAPVNYSRYIQPICLLPASVIKQILRTQASTCFLAGWGVIIPNNNRHVQTLRTAKMNVMTDSQCSQVIQQKNLQNTIKVNSSLCTTYRNFHISGCKGDSGSPLMCMAPDGHWALTGVMSRGSDSCMFKKNGLNLNIFTKITSTIDWIQYIIKKTG